MSKKIKNLYILSYIILVSYTIFIVINYNNLPDFIPIHGTVNSVSAYGDKAFIFAPLVMNLILLIIIYIGIIKVPNDVIIDESSDSNQNRHKIIENKQLRLVVVAIIVTIVCCLVSSDAFFL